MEGGDAVAVPPPCQATCPREPCARRPSPLHPSNPYGSARGAGDRARAIVGSMRAGKPIPARLARAGRDETTGGDAMAQRCGKTGGRPRIRRPLLGCRRQHPATAGKSARRGTGAARFNRAAAENDLPLPHPFRRGMNPVRAIIFDVYKTILDVAEAPLDAEKRWGNLL